MSKMKPAIEHAQKSGRKRSLLLAVPFLAGVLLGTSAIPSEVTQSESSFLEIPGGYTVTLGTFRISMGDYHDWNARAGSSVQCQEYGLDCLLDSDTYRVVGDNTTTATSAPQLQQLYWKFGFECLDKAGLFIIRGKHVYPEVGEFEGPLHQHFLKEANRCWDHYDNIYETNKDKF